MGPKPSGAKNRISTAAVEDINTTPIMEEQQMLHDLFEYWEGPLIESLTSGKTPCKDNAVELPQEVVMQNRHTRIPVPLYHATYTNTFSGVGRNEFYFVPKS